MNPSLWRIYDERRTSRVTRAHRELCPGRSELGVSVQRTVARKRLVAREYAQRVREYKRLPFCSGGRASRLSSGSGGPGSLHLCPPVVLEGFVRVCSADRSTINRRAAAQRNTISTMIGTSERAAATNAFSGSRRQIFGLCLRNDWQRRHGGGASIAGAIGSFRVRDCGGRFWSRSCWRHWRP